MNILLPLIPFEPDTTDDVRWAPANSIAESQTRKLAIEFKSSKPKPRNRVMGFTGKDNYRNPYIIV
jgi:hypothetical protein